MAKNSIRPYEGSAFSLEKILGVALFISLGLHVLASWVFLYVIPAYESSKKDKVENIITVQLLGSVAPPAPAAPAMKVNPDLKGPDVVEVPPAPPEPSPAPIPNDPEPLVTAPADVIPIAPKPPEEPPVIKKTETPPPKVTPPPKKQETPPPKKTQPAQPSLDSQINKRLRELERKTAADNTDDLINQRIMNIAKSQGQGQGESSESYGGATQGERLDPEKARYYSHIRDIVSKNWVAPASALSSNLSAVYQIRIEPDGRVSNSRLRTSSGNTDYDLSVERAVKQSSPFPPLPAVFGGKADTPALRFGLSDMRQGG
ncbi:hypothetical protein C4J81_08275 [Deltaproteobacteria bacterium Smac51]|nr:hypothetical protein C4J81_08275 [Deltaproteobacteria bacterium Smac51]